MKTRHLKILLAGDEAADLYTTKAIIKKTRISSRVYLLDSADNIKNRFHTESFDVIILEFSSAAVDVNNILASLRRNGKLPPVILISNDPDMIDQNMIAEHGVCDCLAKAELTESLLSRSIIYSVRLNKSINELNEKNAMLTGMIQGFDGFIYVCSSQYRIEFMNEALIRRTGYDGTGLLCYRVLHDRNSVCPWCVNEKVFKGETVRWEVQSPKDSRWYYIINTPLYKNDGTIAKQALIQDITERKRTEESLRERDAQFQSIFHGSAIGMFVMSIPDCIITYANLSFHKMMGHRENELAGVRFTDLTHPDDIEAEKSLFREVGKGNKSWFQFEKRCQNKTGGFLWIKTTISISLNKENPAGLAIGMVENITERKQAEEEKNALLAAMPDIMFRMSADGRFIDYYASNPDDLLLHPDTFLNRHLSDVLPAELVKLTETYMDRTLQSGEMQVYEYTTVQDGRQHHWESRMVPCGRSDILSIIRDISERKAMEIELKKSHEELENRVEERTQDLKRVNDFLQAVINGRKIIESALRESESRYRSIVENSHDGIIIVNENHEITYTNDQMCRISGFTFDEIIGRATTEFLDDAGRQTVFDRRMRRMKSEELPSSYELDLISKSGEKRHGQVRVAQFIDSSLKTNHIIQFNDITDRKKMENRWKRSEFIINSAQEFMTLINKDYVYEAVNDSYCRALDKPREQIIGTSIPRLWGDDRFNKRIKPLFDRCMGGETVHDESWIDFPGHGKRYLEISYYPYSAHGGSITHAVVVSHDISKRKLAEEALRISEAGYRSIFENSIGGIFQSTPEGRFISVNSAMARMCGYDSPEEMIAAITDITGQHYVDPEKRKLFEKNLRENGQVKNFEHQVWRKDGGRIWVLINARVVKDEKTGGFYYEGTHEDITQRKHAELSLAESEARLRALIDNLPLEIWSADTNLRYTMQNAKSRENYGNIIGLTITDLDIPSSLKELRLDQNKRALRGDLTHSEYEFNLKGNTRSFENFVAPVISDGSVVGIVGASLDVTGRKESERILNEIRQQQKALLDNIPDIAWVKDRESIYLAVNESFAMKCGKTPEEIVSKTDHDLWPKELAEKYRKDDFGVMESGVRKHIEEPLVDIEGRATWVETIKTPIYGKSGEVIGTAGIARDITERKYSAMMIEAERQRFFDLLEELPLFIYLVDGGFRIHFANRYFRNQFGEPNDRHCYELLMKHDMPCKKCRPFNVFETRKQDTWEWSKSRDGRIYQMFNYPFTDSDGSILALGMGIDITDFRNAETKLHKYQEELRSLSSQLVLAEEKERRRIAVELHDHVGQNLAYCKIKLGELKQQILEQPFSGSIIEMRELIEQSIQYTRTLTYDLSPPILYELGFEPAVEWLGEQLLLKQGIRFIFKDDGQTKPLSDEIKVLLFQSVRELFINIAKHAHADRVDVSIGRAHDKVLVEIRDNGTGFDPSKSNVKKHKDTGYGLFSIRERLKNIAGGEFRILSTDGKGSISTISVPIHQQEIK